MQNWTFSEHGISVWWRTKGLLVWFSRLLKNTTSSLHMASVIYSTSLQGLSAADAPLSSTFSLSLGLALDWTLTWCMCVWIIACEGRQSSHHQVDTGWRCWQSHLPFSTLDQRSSVGGGQSGPACRHRVVSSVEHLVSNLSRHINTTHSIYSVGTSQIDWFCPHVITPSPM